VHPYVRRRVQGSTHVVEDRLHEEHEGKQMLVELYSMGPTDVGFMPLFDQFRTAMLAHAEKEETSEFARLREHTRPAERRAMAVAAKVAAALAPTHPHPGIESATKNILVGTPLAMIDRARDLIREAVIPRVTALQDRANGNANASDETKNKEVIRALAEAFDRADEPAIRDHLSADFVAHGMPPGFTGDANGMVQLATQIKAAVPDHKTVIEDLITQGDKVASRFTSSGMHTGELFGVPASNRTVTVTGIEIYRLAGGQVAEYWGEFNMSDLVGPPTPTAPAPGPAQP
jgi:predicted ester cyclase